MHPVKAVATVARVPVHGAYPRASESSPLFRITSANLSRFPPCPARRSPSCRWCRPRACCDERRTEVPPVRRTVPCAAAAAYSGCGGVAPQSRRGRLLQAARPGRKADQGGLGRDHARAAARRRTAARRLRIVTVGSLQDGLSREGSGPRPRPCSPVRRSCWLEAGRTPGQMGLRPRSKRLLPNAAQVPVTGPQPAPRAICSCELRSLIGRDRLPGITSGTALPLIPLRTGHAQATAQATDLSPQPRLSLSARSC